MDEPIPNLQLVTVFESDDLVAFNLAKSVLEDAGIEYAAVEEALTGYGFSPMLNAPCKIQVAEPDKRRALEVMETMAAPAAPEALPENLPEALPETGEGEDVQP